ncbi:hypothetical protein HK405_002135, partial [Cladochytrium tenue]
AALLASTAAALALSSAVLGVQAVAFPSCDHVVTSIRSGLTAAAFATGSVAECGTKCAAVDTAACYGTFDASNTATTVSCVCPDADDCATLAQNSFGSFSNCENCKADTNHFCGKLFDDDLFSLA